MKQSAKGREYREKFEEGNSSTNDIVFIVTTFIIVFIVINTEEHMTNPIKEVSARYFTYDSVLPSSCYRDVELQANVGESVSLFSLCCQSRCRDETWATIALSLVELAESVFTFFLHSVVKILDIQEMRVISS